MQVQVEEAKSMVVKEREAARKAIEEAPPVIKGTPVMVQDTEKINSLSAEVEKLRVCMLCFSITFRFFWFLCYALLFPCSNEHHCLQKYCISFFWLMLNLIFIWWNCGSMLGKCFCIWHGRNIIYLQSYVMISNYKIELSKSLLFLIKNDNCIGVHVWSWV